MYDGFPLCAYCSYNAETWYRPSSTACGRSPFPEGEGFGKFNGIYPRKDTQ